MKKKVLLALLILLTSIGFLFLTIKILELIHFECIYKKFFNICCAGCGSTRMFKAIFRLNFYQAFRYNPLLFILLIIFIIYIIYNFILYFTNKPLLLPSFKFMVSLGILLIIYMFVRNLPGFEYLLPTKVI